MRARSWQNRQFGLVVRRLGSETYEEKYYYVFSAPGTTNAGISAVPRRFPGCGWDAAGTASIEPWHVIWGGSLNKQQPEKGHCVFL